jgi:hypothetical protein
VVTRDPPNMGTNINCSKESVMILAPSLNY